MVRTFFTDMRATLDGGTAVLFFAALAAVWFGVPYLLLPRDGRPAGGKAAGGGPPPHPAVAIAAWAALAGWTVLLPWLTYVFRKPLFDFVFG